jgi:tetratricopeptide (TPR) repeat protein
LIKDLGAAQRLERNERLQLSKEEIGEELEALEAQLQEDPAQHKLLVRMSEVLLMDDDLVGALQALEQAASLDPQNSDLAAKTGSLRLRVQEGRVRDAEARDDEAAADFARKALAEARVAEYRRQVEQNPTDLRRRFQLGQALFGTGQFDEAIAELQQAVKDPKVKGESLLMLGEAFAAKDMDELAMGQLEKALEVSADTGEKGKEILYAMGRVAQNMGQTQQALEHFSRILEQDIGFRDVQKKIEELKSSD